MQVLRIIVLLAIACVHQSVSVSTKLDFSEESKEIPTHSMKSPKIQGVRVTVDTSKLNQRSTESRSDERDGGSQADSKKKVGIRTDITFELDDEKNSTSSEKDGDGTKEVGKDDTGDAEVPVFKGKPTPGDREGDKNYGNRRNDNFPRGGGGPIFHGTDDESFRTRHDWNNFIPATGIWTTERSQPLYPHRSIIHRDNSPGFRKGYFPYGQNKNCDCKNFRPSTYRQEADYNRQLNYYGDDEMHHNPSYRRSYNQGVDDKLEEPFKVDRGRR